jgi:tungstate transport system substrate-binding protein
MTRFFSSPRALGALAPLLLAAVALGLPAHADERSIILQSTTSTANSGLYDAILPLFTERTGITVHVVAVGTGQAIRNAANGDGDVLLVHARKAEEEFVAAGHGVERFDVMYNDFILIGPADDPAEVAKTRTAAAALQAIAKSGRKFVSRGDDSGTHKKEMQLWLSSGIDPVADSGDWYLESGSGMGATINMTVGMGAYTLTDRGTWISFSNKRTHKIVFEKDPPLFNQYGVILVNPARHSKANIADGQAFIEWILGAEGQAAIAGYQLQGQQLFYPNAQGKSQAAP